jgi:hypothetical protein
MTDINQRRSFLQNVTNDTFFENMKDVYTCIPGYVLTFDPDTQRAQIQLGITQKQTQTGTYRLFYFQLFSDEHRTLCNDVTIFI